MRIPDALSWLARYESGHYKPVTFLERGVTLPFTTPYLLGGRIRPGGRSGAELVLANPAGLEGVYILPWGALPDMCAPTLHDRALWDRVAMLPKLSPRTVRDATRAVAAQGHAGRLAGRAAQGALVTSLQGRVALLRQLLTNLIQQNETAAVAAKQQALPLEWRSRAVLQALCNESNFDLSDALTALEQLAEALELFGLPGKPTSAPLPQTAARIAALANAVDVWAATGSAHDRSFARLLRDSAELTLCCYRHAAAALQPLLAEAWPLIRRWHAGPGPLLELLARPEWLLDGWELILAVWQQAAPASRPAALRDMAALIPVIATEANDWMAQDVSMTMESHQGDLRQWRKTVQANQDWLSGLQVALVARNEALRVLTA